MKKAITILTEAVRRFKEEKARVAESEAARLASLEDARRRRDEAAAEDKLDDYRFYSERCRYFEEMKFEIVPPDFSAEIAAVFNEWGDGIGDACQVLVVAVVQRIEREAQLLKLLEGCPAPASWVRAEDEIAVRALIAAGYLPESDFYWFWSVCHDRKPIKREECPAKMAESQRLIPLYYGPWPRKGNFGQLMLH